MNQNNHPKRSPPSTPAVEKYPACKKTRKSGFNGLPLKIKKHAPLATIFIK